MTLAFRTQWPKDMGEWAGKPTYFVEKIWNSLDDVRDGIVPVEIVNDWHADDSPLRQHYTYGWSVGKEKKHTIREDRFDRWGNGSNIHFAINTRSPDYFQFAPVIKCVSVQNIEISYDTVSYNNDGVHPIKTVTVSIDGKREWGYHDMVKKLAQNDGFESVEQFFAWFNTDFTGKIIHWTDLKY